MTMLLLLHAQADVTCAEQVRVGLEAQGYRVWQEPRSLSLNDPANPRTRAGAVLGCAGVVLVWSGEAGQVEDVGSVLPLVEQLKKPVYALVLDNTVLPQGLNPGTTLTVQTSYTDAVAQLVGLLPSRQGTNALVTLYEKAAHEYIPVRKEAIALAGEMLRRGEEQGRVRAVLEYLASKDMIMGVRELAQKELQEGAGGQTSSPQNHASSHMVEVACPNCKHVNYFDKHVICKRDFKIVFRGNSGGASGHKRELYLNCDKCRKPMVVPVDCRGYE